MRWARKEINKAVGKIEAANGLVHVYIRNNCGMWDGTLALTQSRKCAHPVLFILYKK